jgi:hypothetical protein
MNTLVEFAEEMKRLSRLLDAGLEIYREAPEAEALKERDYRKLRSRKWVDAEGTAKQREEWVDAETADARYDRDIARGLVLVARESVRSRQAQLSAVQTLVNAYRSEAEFSRTGPREGP